MDSIFGFLYLFSKLGQSKKGVCLAYFVPFQKFSFQTELSKTIFRFHIGIAKLPDSLNKQNQNDIEFIMLLLGL